MRARWFTTGLRFLMLPAALLAVPPRQAAATLAQPFIVLEIPSGTTAGGIVAGPDGFLWRGWPH